MYKFALLVVLVMVAGEISTDPVMQAEVEAWKQPIVELTDQKVGETMVLLEGSVEACRTRECNMGSIAADAMVWMTLRKPENGSGEWNHVALAILNGGAMGATTDIGDITIEDILSVAPFHNTIDTVQLRGSTLRAIFEHYVTKFFERRHGKFLQVSGFEVTYNLLQPDESRVVKLLARCTKCTVPQLEPVEDDQVYKVALSNYIYNGGDGYDMIKPEAVSHSNYGILHSDVLINYIHKFSPLTQGLQGRIRFETRTADSASYKCITESGFPNN